MGTRARVVEIQHLFGHDAAPDEQDASGSGGVQSYECEAFGTDDAVRTPLIV